MDRSYREPQGSEESVALNTRHRFSRMAADGAHHEAYRQSGEAASGGGFRDVWPFFRGIPLDLVALGHVIAENCRDQHQLASWKCQKDGEMPDAV